MTRRKEKLNNGGTREERPGMFLSRTLRAWRIRRTIKRSGLFYVTYYLEQAPDVAHQGIDPISHYIRSGADAGLAPNPLFDSGWYLRSYPDVAAAGANPLYHYIKYGASEWRDPGPKFSTSRYMERYPDIGTSGINPLLHFLKQGAAEGRPPHPQQGGYVDSEGR